MTKDALITDLKNYIQKHNLHETNIISQEDKVKLFNDLYKKLHLNDPTKENVKTSISGLIKFFKNHVKNSKQGGSGGPVGMSEIEVYIGVLFVLFGILVTIADTLGYLKGNKLQHAYNTADEYRHMIQQPALIPQYNYSVQSIADGESASPLSENSTGGQKYRKTANKRTVSNKRTTAKRTHK